MKHYLSFLLLSLFAFLSCKKSFLEVPDNSKPNKQGYVKDLNSMQEFMNGIYLQLSAKYENGLNTLYAELTADDMKLSSSAAYMALHYNWALVADGIDATNQRSMNGAWKDYYLIIRACNFVIEDVDKYAAENPEQANNIKGQAYAIRAMVYFRLTNTFAQGYAFTPDASHLSIPYITTSDITRPYSRQTTVEVYNSMIADLQAGITLMPSKITDCRIMNKAAARGLLARVYLFKGDYTSAKNLAVELTEQFPLLSIASGYPDDIYKNKPPTQTEVLFQITPILLNDLLSVFLGRFIELYEYRATTDLATMLKENSNDIRSSWVEFKVDHWNIKKIPEGVAGGVGYYPTTDYYPPMIRSSELYLIAAEANARINDEEKARHYLNAIRKRADPDIPALTETGQALLDLIYKEKRKEFCFEGSRRWELQRLKHGVQRADVLPGCPAILPYPSDKAIAPIPIQDVSLMGLIQNPGY